MAINITKVDGLAERAVLDLDILDVYALARHAREAAGLYERAGRDTLAREAREVDELLSQVAALIRFDGSPAAFSVLDLGVSA